MKDRDLELSSRKESTREKSYTKVVRFELDEIWGHFAETVSTIKSQFPVAEELIKAGKTTEGENIWRAQIVFLTGAFDFYMHELTKYGLCQIYDENWERTEKYDNLQVDMKSIETAMKSEENIDWFLEYINGYYRKITMISFESVKDQCNLLGIDWMAVAKGAFYQRGATEKTRDKLERRLNELFDRRNIIAHQTDREHADAQIKSITRESVENFIEDVEKIVTSINEEAHKK